MAKRSGFVVGKDGAVAGRVRDLARSAGPGRLAISIDTREIGELADLLQEAARTAPAAVARALNRTVEETRTAVARALVKQTGLKFGAVRKGLRLQRASRATLTAAIIARGSFVPLKEFGARRTAKGISAAPWGKRRVFLGTFFIKKYDGNVYVRAGKGRFPIHKLYGPALPVELPRDQSRAAFFGTVPRVLAKRLDHELGRLLTK